MLKSEYHWCDTCNIQPGLCSTTWVWILGLLTHEISSSSFDRKKVKMSGVVTEDKMTGDMYITHVTTMEDTMGGKMSDPEQTDSQNAEPGKKIFRWFLMFISCYDKSNKNLCVTSQKLMHTLHIYGKCESLALSVSHRLPLSVFRPSAALSFCVFSHPPVESHHHGNDTAEAHLLHGCHE